jgi:putative DNA primase/helicase
VTETAFARIVAALEQHGQRVTGAGDSRQAQCPAHDDGTASLSLKRIEGQALVFCHAGCGTDAVLGELGMSMRDLFDTPSGVSYRYGDGRVVHRYYQDNRKSFSQSGNTKGAELYHATLVRQAVAAGRGVLVVEGEKDVLAAESIGVTATCSAMGAGKATKFDWSPLTGATVMIVADRDEPGEKHARDVQQILDGIAAKVTVVRAKVGKDTADHIAAGLGVHDFIPLDDSEPTEGTSTPSGDLWPSPADPMAVARQFMRRYSCDEWPTLRRWRGGWMRWMTEYWVEVEDATVRSEVYAALEHATYATEDGVKPWCPNRHKVANVLEALHAVTHLADAVNPPAWLGAAQRRDTRSINAREIVSATNGLLHVTTRELMPHTPEFFNLVSVPFDHQPAAACPAWHRFLGELWSEDPDSISALQEWFGYVLSGRTDHHKILLTTGPSRSGKGTIARVMQRLIGPGNAAGPTLSSLASNFGLAPLLGKPLAVVSDARLAGNTHLVVERLLTISGEDTLTIDRKFREPWTGRLPTRFVILSNELPAFGDASGAIAYRFVVLAMTHSWLGKENTALTDELSTELPGILNWALDGLDRLVRVGRFTAPQASEDAIVTMLDNASPMSAFVRDTCDKGAGLQVSVDELFATWRRWCEENERKPGTKQLFGRNLKAVCPGVRVHRPRDDDGAQHRMYLGLALKPSWSGFAVNRDSSRLSDSTGVPTGAEPRRDATQRKSGLTHDGLDGDENRALNLLTAAGIDSTVVSGRTRAAEDRVAG